MTKQHVIIQPGPIFYEVWSGLMKALGLSVMDWCSDRKISHTGVKQFAGMSISGQKSKEIRDLMIKEVGEELFAATYEARLRRDGYIQ